MSVNSSSSVPSDPSPHKCLTSRRAIPITTAIIICYILLLPLLILVLYVGYQRWRKQRSGAAAAKTSHSDIFTFNMVVLELMVIVGFSLVCFSTYTHQGSLQIFGSYIYGVVILAQALFHLLTCVERYLAVVHPVTYVGLKHSGGVRIRNISIVCVWLLSFGLPGLSVLNIGLTFISGGILLGVSSVVVSFCSVSVLRALIRPGPGEVCGGRERVDQSKQRAFHTVMAITGALLLKCLSTMVSFGLSYSSQLSESEKCFLNICIIWFNLPSSLVLPLLFLQRAGKLPGCKYNSDSH